MPGIGGATSTATARAAPGAGFDSRPIKIACVVLVALYAWLLAGVKSPYYNVDLPMLWAAGHLAAGGDAAAVYNLAMIKAALPLPLAAVQFFYPPVLLVFLAPLGMLPYGVAATIWLAGSVAAYVAAVRATLPGATALLLAFGAAPVLFNLMLGQTGLLLAGLLGGALALIDTRPWIAGMLIGLIACKPHYGVLFPLYLALTGRWRVFAGAAVTVVALAVVTLAVFGADAFSAFAGALGSASGALQQQGQLAQPWDWRNLASVRGLLHKLGVAPGPAWWGHLAIAVAAASGCLVLAAGKAPEARKAAALVVAAFLIPPYAIPSDSVILVLALLLLVRDGLQTGSTFWQNRVLGVVFVLPLVDFAMRILMHMAGYEGYGWVAPPLMSGLLAAVIAARTIAAAAPAGRQTFAG